MTLLLDVGNSRLKWALLAPSTPRTLFAAQGAVELRRLRAHPAELTRLLMRAGSTAIHVCNVAGPELERQLRAAARSLGLQAPRFAHTAAAQAGVRNGYREAWRLGVDRWLGMIGARRRHPGKNLCIVGVGTALTIDLLSASGRHQGGCLIPGPQLMIDALMAGTAGIARRAGGRRALRAPLRGLTASERSLFAADTRAGLRSGAHHACAALIEQALRDGRSRLGRRPQLLLAGGASEVIAPLLTSPYYREDDLVLRGLAVLALPPPHRPRL
jgi:type III pantothenate kinase